MPLRILKTKWFKRFAEKHKIADDSLKDAVERAQKGLIDADLGRNLIKQRVARPGQGARGGYRVFVAWDKKGRAVLLYGFPKSERENLKPNELEDWQDVAAIYLKFTDAQIDQAVQAGEAFEIKVEDNDEEV